MKYLVCIFLLFFSPVLNAQIAGFPESWEGSWKGEVTIFSPNGSTHRVPVSLIVAPLDSLRWSWTLFYEAPNQSPREYELVKDGTTWKIDEKNGVVLPQQFLGNRMASSFSVAGTLLICYYWLENEVLNMEIHTAGQQGNAANKGTEVSVHSVGAFQKATLYRK